MVIAGAAVLLAQEKQGVPQGVPMEAAASSRFSVRRMTDEGAMGSRAMKPSREFPGKPITPPLRRYPLSSVDPHTLPARKPGDEGVSAGASVTIAAARAASFRIGETPRTNTGTNALAVQPRIATPWAQLISPQYGDTLAPTETFTWTAGSGVEFYYVWLGSCYDCTDILSEYEGLSLSRTLALPNDGRTLYMTLFSYIAGQYYWVDYQFTASTAAVASVLTSPANGATLGSPQTFAWTEGIGVSDHFLMIGSCEWCTDILNEDEGANLSKAVSLPIDGRPVYVFLFSEIGGEWFYWEYQFHAGSGHAVRVFLDNKLGYALNVYVNGGLVGSVNAYSEQYADVVVDSLAVSFELIQPTVNGKTLGDAMAGYFSTIDNASGDYTFTVTNVIGSDFYMLPVITNQAAVALDMEVNGGLDGQNICGCSIPAFGQNVAAGYYHEYSNSNIRLFRDGANYSGPYVFFGEDANGQIAPSGLLYKLAAANSGVVSLVNSIVP
jgi:hypothetical protein